MRREEKRRKEQKERIKQKILKQIYRYYIRSFVGKVKNKDILDEVNENAKRKLFSHFIYYIFIRFSHFYFLKINYSQNSLQFI